MHYNNSPEAIKCISSTAVNKLCDNLFTAACGVTLSVYPHQTGLKDMPGHGGIKPMTFVILAHNALPTELRGRQFQYVIFWN